MEQNLSSQKRLFIGLVIIAAVLVGAYVLRTRTTERPAQQEVVDANDYKNIAYTIDGAQVTLRDGVAVTDAAPGSASKITTRYFGNELQTDLDGDGRADVAFILAQDRGGSGTFYYAVAARNTGHGYVGSDGYLLGDRIAPQSTTLSPNPNQRYVVVFNYADRAANEPMTAAPIVGKSAYLKLDPTTMRWAVVLPDFTGEAR